MKFIKKIKNIVKKVPYVNDLSQNVKNFFNLHKDSYYPPGHYYSTIVSIKELKKRESEIWNKDFKDGIAGIDLRKDDQIELIYKFNEYYNEIPFKSEKHGTIRYSFENEFYSYTDAIVLYSFMRYLKPKRIIEIGSGFSSAVMLDINDLFFNNKINLTFIEPYPERLYSIMTENDKNRNEIITSAVQKISIDNFKKLQAGDILFIDSSHVVKTGSDVNYILFEILPILNSGVYIHFHDIFYPFEYPKEWVFQGFNWNEDYFLKAFLMYNNNFEIRLFSDYIHKFHKLAFKDMPLTYNNSGGNLWLEKK